MFLRHEAALNAVRCLTNEAGPRKAKKVRLARLFVAEHNHGIHARRASRRQEAGDDSNCN